MKTNEWKHVLLAAAALVFTVLIGCRDKSVAPATEDIASEDIATSIAGAVGEEDGGVADQMGDVSALTIGSGSLGKSEVGTEVFASAGIADTVSKSYDAGTQTWTVVIQRSRTSNFGLYTANFSRVYTYKFLNKLGAGQQNYITGPDTAYSIVFTIVQGSGLRRTPFRVHRLDSLSGGWMITGTNTATLTINSTTPYYNAGSDTIKTRQAVRTLNHSLTMTFTDCKVPRGGRLAVRTGASGTVSGQYNATATFQKGDLYNERTISRSFTVEFSGGIGICRIGLRQFHIRLADGEFEND